MVVEIGSEHKYNKKMVKHHQKNGKTRYGCRIFVYSIMLDDFIKDYDRKRYNSPKAKIGRRILFGVLIIVLILDIIRAIILMK